MNKLSLSCFYGRILHIYFILGRGICFNINSIPSVGKLFRPPSLLSHSRYFTSQRYELSRIQTCSKRPRLSNSALASDANEFVEAEDLEALQVLFTKYCDEEGLMTKGTVMAIPAVADLLANGDLLLEEFNDIWDKAPKFPDVNSEDRIDVDSFVQVYRDIDDMFEVDGDEDTAKTDSETLSVEPLSSTDKNGADDAEADSETVDDIGDERMEDELESIFESLCNKDKLVSRGTLLAWDEVGKLLEEGLLGQDEFDELWEKTEKSPGSNKLDVEGFLSFNVALDGLFDFDDITDSDDKTEPASKIMVEGDNLAPSELFNELAGSDGTVARGELLLWSELKELLEDGELLQSELDALFEKAGSGKKLNEAAFLTLYNSINDLFEDADDNDGKSNVPSVSGLKEELLDALSDLNDPDLLPCGLDATESEQKEILSIVSDLESHPSNLVRSRDGDIAIADLTGTWELIYSSSSAFKFNKGLSGLGGSFPNGKFGGLRQKLQATKFLSDVEYIERIEVNPSTASFDVTVTGDWDLVKSVSLFTGEPSLVLTVTPALVNYGPTSTKADHWKSLGPMNMLDITYLDDNLRIMRGNTAVENIFIFRRVDNL